MKRRLSAALLVLCLLFSLTACGTTPAEAASSAVSAISAISADSAGSVSEPETDEGTAATEAPVGDTIGSAYLAAFLGSEATEPAALVDALIARGIVETDLVAMPVEPGYLNGFDSEISGFTEGVMFSPMIGAIPFVGYVFRTEDPAALKDTLTQNANLAWNVCTEADELVCIDRDDLVFFLMCANEEF